MIRLVSNKHRSTRRVRVRHALWALLWAACAQDQERALDQESSTQALCRAGSNAVSAGDALASMPGADDAWRGPSHAKKKRCGNGQLDKHEACDDGNVQSGDGCDSRCQRDDSLQTSGDDRAGFVQCTSSSGTSLSCGPGLGCCPYHVVTPGQPLFEPLCAATKSECGLSLVEAYYACDGPEDCGSGQVCTWTRYESVCSDSVQYALLCHVDSDCVQIAGSVCDAGRCVTQ